MWAWLVASQVRLFSDNCLQLLLGLSLLVASYTATFMIRAFLAISLSCIPYRTHLTGVINHGYGVLCYIDLLTWPHDANLVINVLVDTILKKERLPPVLYLQLDNTARENKNQFVMTFLSYLVQVGVFKEVRHVLASEVSLL